MIDASDAVVAAGARAIGTLPGAFDVATDTRRLAPGDAFVALRGERYDGHDYLAEAVARGASVLVVEDAGRLPAGASALVVVDTTRAYLAFGALARDRRDVRVVAITGSAGKTTTKAFVAQLLEGVAPARVAATVANENNEIGVAKLLLSIPPGARYVVVEFGARRYGEIAPLAHAARPDVAVLTNVGEAHLAIMGSAQRLADTKWGVFSTGAQAVLDATDEVSRARARALERPVTWFALDDEGDDLPLGDRDRVVRLVGRTRLEVRGHEHAIGMSVACDVPGDHNRRNASAAVAAAVALGVRPVDAGMRLRDLALPAGRYERMPLGDAEAIYDAYNASTSGMLATLRSFANEVAPRRIAVLGSMAELGADEADMHACVGAAAAGAGLDVLLVGGDFAIDLERGARAAGLAAERIVRFATNAVAVAWLRANLRTGDLVLLKGSRRYKLEEIVASLRDARDRARA